MRGAKDLLRNDHEKKTLEEMLEEAEKSFKIAEAEAARGLEYEICRCTWPPQIMLEVGGRYHFRCSKCGSEIYTTPTIGVAKSKIGGTLDHY